MSVRPHEPVLADEVVGLLAPSAGAVVVDCTFGAGGHARRLAASLGPEGLYVGIDRDPLAAAHFAAFADDVVCRTRFVRADFASAIAQLGAEGLRADALLMDLGLSSMQIDEPERGFSYSAQAPLDMRMDPDLERSAADLVATASEADLVRWFSEYGEERYSRRIAAAIVRRRRTEAITTTGALVDVVRAAVPGPAPFSGGHPAKRVFQALRVAVNGELELLDAALGPALELLRPGGRLAVIAFHSLEDRRVKRAMRDWTRGPEIPREIPMRGEPPRLAEALTPRVVRPGAGEVNRNPRARSARLRAIRRNPEGPA